MYQAPAISLASLQRRIAPSWYPLAQEAVSCRVTAMMPHRCTKATLVKRARLTLKMYTSSANH